MIWCFFISAFGSPGTGFSYNYDAPLDMRMDDSSSNNRGGHSQYTLGKGRNIIYRFGEERWARRIASFIVEQKAPINTTGQLTQIIRQLFLLLPGAGSSPRRTFMALRIAVNDELSGIEEDASRAGISF